MIENGCLITVQDNTMLKPAQYNPAWMCCLITVQDNTMLKPILLNILNAKSLITVQDNTMLKPGDCICSFPPLFNYRSG